jgi:hypothetical protein
VRVFLSDVELGGNGVVLVNDLWAARGLRHDLELAFLVYNIDWVDVPGVLLANEKLLNT